MPRFIPRQRKHKVRARETTSTAALPQSDSNQEQITPVSKSEREEKRVKLREELRSQQSSISSKKQKRLDKYIENKLKKDENLDYLRKLEQEKEKYDALNLQSSKTFLGKRKYGDSVNNGLKSDIPKTIPKSEQTLSEENDDLDSAESEDSFEADHASAFEAEVAMDSVGKRLPEPASRVQQGSGLAQPLSLGSDGLPVIQTRMKGRTRKSAQVDESKLSVDELSWEGFDSDDIGEGGEDTESQESGLDFSANEDFESGDSDDENEQYDETDDGLSGSSSTTSETSAEDRIRPRTSAFKTWATQQLNQSLGHIPSYENSTPPLPPQSLPSHSEPPKPLTSLVQPTLEPPKSNRKAYAVHVRRGDDIELSRTELPILQREQEIMEAVHNNPVVVIKGETGSGKTTQIPQFLYEAGYGSPHSPTPGLIGVTQPRRVAAVSMARRVAEELGEHGDKVSYQIRFDSSVTPRTAIKFMTDGILLRELSQDLLLRKYSVIVIDEAHERSVNTDILIGMLSKIVPARTRRNQFNPNPTPLKVIIMSATLDIADFLNDKLFPPGSKPPVVEAEGRQHRVTTHFALRSRPDYLEEVVEKIRRAHRKLPRGGILVFLTGQNEIREVSNRLRRLLAPRDSHNGVSESSKVHLAASETPLETEDMDFGSVLQQEEQDDFDVDILTQSEDEVESNEFDVSDDENADSQQPDQKQIELQKAKEPYTSVHILPLYSQLPTKEQLRVFDPPPVSSRLMVLATNVAETSLTIPGIRYVFDSGRSKERKYNLDTGVQSFEIDYISKASASQRAGRAGRTGPGHCWRLYSSAVYEQFFPEHAQPEILRAPAESIVLQLKGVEYPKPIVEFPFPTPPAMQTLVKAERLLKNLGALTDLGMITALGKELSVYPLSPRLGKILATGVKDTSLRLHLVSLVAGLAVSEVFINESQIDMTPQGRQDLELYTHADQQEDDEREKRRQAYGRARATLSRQDKSSDALKLLTAVTMYTSAVDREGFCREHFLRPKAMSEVMLLQRQLLDIVKANNPAHSETSKHGSKLSSKQLKQLNAVAASGYVDQVAIRADLSPNPPAAPHKPRRAIDVPYLPLIPLTDQTSASPTDKMIFIHPSSVLARGSHKDLPQYIVYSHLQKSQAHTIGGEASTKTRMFPLTPVEGAQLVELAKDTALLEYGKPVPKTKVDELPGTPKRRECWVTTELRGGGAGSFGWPLPPLRVRQVMDVKSSTGWRAEEVLI